MHFKFSTLIFQGVLAPLLAAGTLPLSGWNFSSGPEFPGASGQLRTLPDSLQLSADFRNGGKYVAARYELNRPLRLRELQFQVKSGVPEMTVGFRDTDGKNRQHTLALSGDPEVWQCVKVPVPGGTEPSPGAKIKGLSLAVNAAGLPGEKGSIAFRNVLCLEAGEGSLLLPLPMDAASWRLNNGPEFRPGTRASITSDGSTLTLKTDASAGGDYAGISYALKKKLRIRRLHFKMRGANTRYAVRFIDATGQYHNHERSCPGAPGSEQAITMDVAASRQHWGGRNDGKFHPPLAAVELIVCGRFFGPAKRGETAFSAVELESDDPEAFLPLWNIADPLDLFRQPGDVSPVKIRAILPKEIHRKESLRYSCRDYRGAEVATGYADYDAKNGRILLIPSGERGFHEYDFPRLGIHFGMMTDDPPPRQPDPYFGMDGSFSWGDPPGDETGIRTYLKILRNNGIFWNRDRLDWSSIERTRGAFDFGRRFGLYRRIAQEEKIHMLDTFHDAPAWTGAEKVDRSRPSKNNPFPHDLLAAGNSWLAIASHWKQDALEVWNEPDIGFGNSLPAEYVTAFTKAVSRVFSAAGCRATIGGGVFASPRPGTNFYRTYIDNGLLADADFISFHTYGNVAELEPLIEDMRKTEQLSGSPNLGLPYWITECGKPRPYAGVSRGTTAPDQFSAAEIAGKAAEFRALGVERHFAFEYKFRKENANNFGLMDFNRTPMRGMAAYTHLVRVLSHRRYIGDLQGTNAFRARVFAGENDLVAVLYNGLKEQRKQYVTLPRTLKPLRATGIDGRPLPIANGRVSNADGITYLYFTQQENPGLIHPETRAMKLYRLAKSYRPRARAARPLVLQSTTDLSNFIISNRGFFLPNPDELELKVLVNNFGSTALKFHPEVELPAGASLLRRPEAVTIPAGGRTEVRFRIALDAGTQSTFQTVRLTDAGGNATPIAFSLAPFLRREVEIHAEPAARPIPSSLSGLKASGNWIDFSGPANWTPWEGDKTTPDIEAGFRAFYTPEELVFLVLVKDARHVNPYSAFESWQGDSVQLTIQQRGADKNPVPGKRFHEIAAARSREGDLLYAHIGTPRGVLQKSKLEFRPLEKGWFLYIIRLNGKELGLTLKPGSILGSSMLVNSNPGSGRAGFLTWGFGISPEKNDVLFQLLRLK